MMLLKSAICRQGVRARTVSCFNHANVVLGARRWVTSGPTPRSTATVAAFNEDTFDIPVDSSFRSPSRVPPRVNVLENLYNSQYYDTLGTIMKIRERYIRDRNVFIESESMIPILKALGAKDEDFAKIQKVSDDLPADPTLPFRESKNGRFCLDVDQQAIRRLEFQPFALSVTEDFKRHDSDQVRRFDEIRDDLQQNSVFQTLLLFKGLVIHGVPTQARPNLNYASNKWICTVFNLRTITTPELLGEPALEGVHTDGVDHTMTTFLGSKNMNARSCVTVMHHNSETTGIPHDETHAAHLAGVSQHRNLLDTLLIVDNERKHSISALVPVDERQKATRDMLIFFTRRPATKGHVSEHIDSTTPHQSLVMEIPLWLPRQHGK